MAIKVFCTAPIKRFLPYLKMPSNINLKIAEYATGLELESGLLWCDRHISNARIKLTDVLIERSGGVEQIYQPSIGFDNITIDRSKFDTDISGLWNELEFRKSQLTTAEHTLTLILAHLKNLTQLLNDVKETGSWDNRRYHLEDLCDQNVGIVGFGCVGQGLAKLVQAFGSNVMVHDPYIEIINYERDLITLVDYEKILTSCDIISFHTPLNMETKNMFRQEHISMCSKAPLVVNCARGGIVNEDAIINALNSNQISGYVTDVLENEDPLGVYGTKLVSYSKDNPRVLITPHVGGSSFMYMKNVFQIALDRISNAN